MRLPRTVALALVCPLYLTALQNSEASRYFEQARQSFAQKKWDEAQSAAAKALAADPRMGDAEILIGLVDTVRSQFAAAEKHFAHAISLEPRNYQAHGYLGSTYLQESACRKRRPLFEGSWS